MKLSNLLLVTLVVVMLRFLTIMPSGSRHHETTTTTSLKHNVASVHHDFNNDKASTNDPVSRQHTALLLPKYGDTFAPGTLNMTRLETYSKCYTNPRKYRHHFHPKGVKCSISETYNVIYFMIAKSGSSTSRHVMENSFDGVEQGCKEEFNDTSKFHFTFFREPTSRFYSSYQEMLERLILWDNKKKLQTVPLQYSNFSLPFSDIKRRQYNEMFDSKVGQDIMRVALEVFVHDYNAKRPFDGHLRLQIPRLSNRNTGLTERLDGLYDSSHMQQGFNEIATQVGAPTPVDMIRAYDKGTRRLNTSSVSLETRRKICQLSALDYCCLNYKLPPECKGTVSCRWIRKPRLSRQLLIEPVPPYPP